jgi:methylase of polypeptide subunit release factors
VPVERVEFGSLSIAYDADVLRPRQWTVAQSSWAAELLARTGAGPVLELCSGVGQIGLLAVSAEPRDLVMVDANPRAAELARLNIEAAALPFAVEVRLGLMDEVMRPGERFVGVIADPPYLPSASLDRYPEDPTLAIDGGVDGLDLAWACLRVAAAHLEQDGWVLLQLATRGQAADIEARIVGEPLGLEPIEVREYERGVVQHLARRGR